jgi:glycosyltransferase involved in cell wall biosynthesis
MIDVLVISDDVVGKKMAGPGIRAWEISKCLAGHFKVTLAIPDYSDSSEDGRFFDDAPFDVIRYSVQKPSKIKELGEQSRIILFQGYVLSKFPDLKGLPAPLIADIYVPFVLENLFVHKWSVPDPKDREYIHVNDLKVFNEQILRCDFFLCANSRQKDLFIGSLMSLNRINPGILDQTPNLDELICVVPFGLSLEEKQAAKGDFINRQFPGIKEDDILFLWGGVLTNWFDPITLIRAFKDATDTNSKIKLLFMSTKHANPLLPEFNMAKKALQTADKLGMRDTRVFFNQDWVDYDHRGSYFERADIGLSINPPHFENHFSFRTRMLDYLKHDLPILCSEGDSFSEIVRQEQLGIVVASGDQTGLKQAILELADNNDLREKIRQNIRAVKRNFLWEQAVEPLILYCQNVLSGRIKKKKPPVLEGLKTLFVDKKERGAKKIAKKYLWPVQQKLPKRLTTKIRRVLKT